MPEFQQRPRQSPSSLATKIILLVFAATLGSVLAVSAIAIHASRAQVRAELEREAPDALERAAERLESWLARGAPHGGSPATPGERPVAGRVPRFDRSAAASLLAAEPAPAGGRWILFDRTGRSLAESAASDGAARTPVADVPADSRLREIERTGSSPVAVAVRSLAGDSLRLAVEIPMERAFAPVLSLATRLVAVDLCLVLLASFLALRLTQALVHPIHALSEAARRIAHGQLDHEIGEPPSRDEIGLLARSMNDMMRQLRGAHEELEAVNRDLLIRNAELQQAKETFEQLSITDGLTKLHNHRFFQDQLTREIKRVGRVVEPLSMLMIDLDDFKTLNDRMGHAAGDELLAAVARILNRTVRESDLLARYGGEEFVVLTPNTDLYGSYRLAEKIRIAIAETSFVLDESLRPARVTVSVGVAQYTGNRKRFFQSADRALYRAKERGKNCVVMDEPGADGGSLV
jgi:diguanylate cyclase (GGDEF)-like protein